MLVSLIYLISLTQLTRLQERAESSVLYIYIYFT